MKHSYVIFVWIVSLFIVMSLAGCQPSGRDAFSSNLPTASTISSETATTTETVSTTATEMASAVTTTTKSALSAESRLAATAKLAESLAGKAYQYGAAGPDSFDNSGFIVYCFARNGMSLPRKTGDMAKAGTGVDKTQLEPGDVLFFFNDNPGAVEYAGIYLGNNQFAASNTEDTPVSIHLLTSNYFETRFLFARRFF